MPQSKEPAGYECLLLSDCTAATDYGNYMATLKTMQQAGGAVLVDAMLRKKFSKLPASTCICYSVAHTR